MPATDWLGMIAVYEAIGKQRDLTEEELERVQKLTASYKRSIIDKKYRDANKEERRKRDRERYKNDPKKRARDNELARKRRAEGNKKSKMSGLRSRERHPERVAALRLKKRLKANEIVKLEEGAKKPQDKLAVWETIASQRELDAYEKSRVKYLHRLLDPNDRLHEVRRARNKRQWQSKKARGLKK